MPLSFKKACHIERRGVSPESKYPFFSMIGGYGLRLAKSRPAGGCSLARRCGGSLRLASLAQNDMGGGGYGLRLAKSRAAPGCSLARRCGGSLRLASLSVAVPDMLLGFKKPASPVDRGHSLRSLLPPQAALPSLPLGMTWGVGVTDCDSLRAGLRPVARLHAAAAAVLDRYVSHNIYVS